MFFNNLKLYLADPATGLLKVRYTCTDCGVEMDQPYYYRVPCCDCGIVVQTDKATFLCEDCYMERMKNINKTPQLTLRR